MFQLPCRLRAPPSPGKMLHFFEPKSSQKMYKTLDFFGRSKISIFTSRLIRKPFLAQNFAKYAKLANKFYL